MLPDGRHAISAGTQGTVRVWEIDSGRELRRFPAGGMVPRIAVTSDGRRFLAAGNHQSFAVRDMETGKEVMKLMGHTQTITDVALLSGDRRALSASLDKTVRLWDLETGKELRQLVWHSQPVFRLAATPDGRHAISSGPDNTVRLWNLETGKEIRRINVAGHCLSVSPDSRRLLIGTPAGLILWDLKNGKEMRRLAHADWGFIFAIQLLADGRRALIGTRNGWLALIDVNTGRELSRMKGPAGQFQLALLPSGDRVRKGDGTPNLTRPVPSSDRALTDDTDGAFRLWSVPLAASPEQAAARFQRLLTEVADQPLLRGQVLDQAVRWEPIFQKLRALRSEDVQLWVARGSYHARIGEREKALADYLKAAEVQPENNQWKKRAAQLRSDLIAAWNFDIGAADWSAAFQCRITPANGVLKVESTGDDPQMTVPVQAPPGWKKLTIHARFKEPIKAQVFWATSVRPGYAEQFSEWFDMRPVGDAWTESTVYFNAEANLTSIRFDPGGAGSRLEIDSITFAQVRDKTDFEQILVRLNESIKQKPNDAQRRLARGRIHADMGNLDLAAGDFAKALALVPEAQRAGIDDELVQHNDIFARVTKLRPKDRQLWVAKLNRHATHAQWKDAAVAAAKLTEFEPSDHLLWFNQAPILVEIGDLDGYRRVCGEMLKRFSKTDKPEIAERTAKTCLLAPDAVSDLKAVVKLADQALTGTEKSGLYKWFLLARGMADYRTGKYAAAVERLSKALTPGREYVYLDGTANLFIAMAQHRLGHEAEAGQSLAKARTLMEQQSPKLDQGQLLGGDWSDWLRFKLARREAEALLESKTR